MVGTREMGASSSQLDADFPETSGPTPSRCRPLIQSIGSKTRESADWWFPTKFRPEGRPKRVPICSSFAVRSAP